MNNINKYSIQVAVFAAAITIGIVAGSLFTNNKKNKEQDKLVKELILKHQEERKAAEKKLVELETIITVLEEDKSKKDSLISNLNNKIKQGEKKLAVERKQKSKLNGREKKQYLLQRYNEIN